MEATLDDGCLVVTAVRKDGIRAWIPSTVAGDTLSLPKIHPLLLALCHIGFGKSSCAFPSVAARSNQTNSPRHQADVGSFVIYASCDPAAFRSGTHRATCNSFCTKSGYQRHTVQQLDFDNQDRETTISHHRNYTVCDRTERALPSIANLLHESLRGR